MFYRSIIRLFLTLFSFPFQELSSCVDPSRCVLTVCCCLCGLQCLQWAVYGLNTNLQDRLDREGSSCTVTEPQGTFRDKLRPPSQQQFSLWFISSRQTWQSRSLPYRSLEGAVETGKPSSGSSAVHKHPQTPSDVVQQWSSQPEIHNYSSFFFCCLMAAGKQLWCAVAPPSGRSVAQHCYCSVPTDMKHHLWLLHPVLLLPARPRVI